MGETIDYIIKNKRPMFHYVGQALSGKKGLEMVAMNTPDILLADIMMPGMDGLTMIQQLKDVFPAVKVVIITAYDDFTFVQRALRMGAVDYLLKPFKPETLLSILDKIYEELEDKQLAVSNPYPALISQLYHRLSNQIQNGQIEQASILFQEIWQELTSSVKSDTVLIRTRSVEIATAIIHLTDEKSYCHEALTLTYSTFISKVAKTQTADDIELCLKEFLQTCSEVFYQYSSQSEYEIISRIKELIEMNLKKNITLESVAQKVYLLLI
jgi:two-component system response regulator YesN